jgi:hypothetical protein
MSLLPILRQAAVGGGTAAVLYAASVTLTVLVSLLTPRRQHRADARETLKILLRRKP